MEPDKHCTGEPSVDDGDHGGDFNERRCMPWTTSRKRSEIT